MMKKIAFIALIVFVQIGTTNAQEGMGIGTSNPEEMLDVNGAIKIGSTIVGTPDAGSIRWNGTNFQGFDGTQWINFGGTTGGGNTLDDSYNEGGPGVGRAIDATNGALRVNGDDGFIVTGTYGSGDEVEVSGYGSRMFFNPRRAAFRAGLPSGIQWDLLNIGNYSMGLGFNTIARGDYSFSSGSATTALGAYSTVMGEGTFAQSAYEMAVGRYNTLGTGSNTGWNPADRIFSVGIGTHNNSREDALVILKNGNIGVGTNAPTATLDVEGSIQILDGNEAAGKVLTSDANGNATWQVAPAGADDLGNHTATTNIQLQDNWLSNDGGNEGVRIDNTGNVGIGTATPADKLDVNGGIRSYIVGLGNVDIFTGVQNFVNLSSDNHGGVVMGSNFYSSGGALRIANTHPTLSGSGIFIPGNFQPGQGSLFFYASPPTSVTAGSGFGGAEMVLATSGNLGVGTTNPTAKLHIGGTAGVDGIRFPDGTLQTTAATGGSGDDMGDHTATQNVQLNGNWLSNDGGNEGIAVTSAGDVGIGTNSPGARLSVTSASGSGLLITPGNAEVHIGTQLAPFGTTGEAYRLAIQPYGHTGGVFNLVARDDPSSAYLDWKYGTGASVFTMRHDGRIGLGVTNPSAKLHIGGTAGVDGIRFPDGTLQTTAATGGAGDDLGNHSATTTLDMNSNRILEVGTPTTATDAANKAYVDAHTDADADASNELQTLSISGSDISLSNGGGTVTIPSTTTNTLDGAYDQGGAGAGRAITADAGAVSVQGTDGFEVTGTFGSGAAIGAPGAGTRMFFNPAKAAFRAGHATNNEWDDLFVGSYSFAGGLNPEASGNYSVAFSETVADGEYSFSMGRFSKAIGDYSVAMGYDNDADGDYSVAFGAQNQIEGNYSFSSGHDNTVDGDYSYVFGNDNFIDGISPLAVVFGYDNTIEASGGNAFGFNNNVDDGGTALGSGNNVEGDFAMAFGILNTTSGWSSSAFGEGSIARSNAEFVVGQYNTDYIAQQDDFYHSTDRVFVVGNGTSGFASDRSDAMVVLKNGNTGLGTSTPDATLDVEGTVQIVDGNEGAGKVLTSDASGNATWQTAGGGGTLDDSYDLGSAGAGRIITADAGAVSVQGTDGLEVTGAFGSGAAIGTPGSGTRMFFNPRKAAFRAGEAASTEWDDGNVGNYSIAMGQAAEALGYASVAMGSGLTASGDNTVALGSSVDATATGAIGIGQFNMASGGNSIAIGLGNNATAQSATAIGTGSTASGDYSTAIGTGATATAYAAVSLGEGSASNGAHSTTTGLNTTANGHVSTATGLETTAESYGEFTVGLYDTDYTPTDIADWAATDRVFVVGNGVDAGTRSDALVVLKNGNTGLGTSTPDATLDVEGTMQLVDGNEGAGKVLTSDASGNATWQTPSGGSGGSGIAAENFVGSISNFAAGTTFYPAFNTTQNTDATVFETLSTGNNGIRVQKAGVISWDLNLNLNFSSSGFVLVGVFVDGVQIEMKGVTASAPQFDFFNGGGSYYVNANQVVTYEINGLPLDNSGGNNGLISMTWMGTP